MSLRRFFRRRQWDRERSMQLIKALLFGISPLDPLTYAVVPVVLGMAAALASYLPARRAAAVDPVETLKAE